MVSCDYMHGFPPYIYPQPVDWPFMAIALPILVAAVVWTLVLKGFSLWYAARGGQKGWFVALLIINTFGILEVIYLIWFRPTSFELEERPTRSSSLAA